MKKIYLAIPYSGHEDESFEFANVQAGHLMQSGYVVFSPISHSRPIAQEMGVRESWEFWRKQDFPMIEWCDELWVCAFGDWEKSTGVVAEIKEAERLGKKVRHMVNDNSCDLCFSPLGDSDMTGDKPTLCKRCKESL